MVAPLDPSLLVIEDRDREFLHTAISSNDEELRARIFQIQKKYVNLPSPRGGHFDDHLHSFQIIVRLSQLGLGKQRN